MIIILKISPGNCIIYFSYFAFFLSWKCVIQSGSNGAQMINIIAHIGEWTSRYREQEYSSAEAFLVGKQCTNSKGSPWYHSKMIRSFQSSLQKSTEKQWASLALQYRKIASVVDRYFSPLFAPPHHAFLKAQAYLTGTFHAELNAHVN